MLDASIDEPAGGLIARALSLPGLPPVSLQLAGSGAASDWRGRLRAVAGPADSTAPSLWPSAMRCPLTSAPMRMRPVAWRRASLHSCRRHSRSSAACGGSRGEARCRAPRARRAGGDGRRLSGGLDLDAASVQASFDIAVADGARWRPLLAPTSLNAAHLAGSVSGSLDQPHFALQTSIDHLVAPQISAARVDAKVAGSATLRDRQVVTFLSIAAEGTSSGIAVADARLAAVIGNAAAWSITGNVDLARGEMKIEQAKIAAGDATIAAAGSIAAYGRAVNATVQADFNDVGPLAQALDQPVAGRLGLTASLSGDAVAPRLSAVVNGNFRDLALDEPTLMKLLGTAPTIKGTFVATDTTVEIGALEIAGADGTLTADGSASLDGTSLALNLAVAVPEIAPLTASLAGAVGGRLAGQAACHARATRSAAAFRGNGRPGSVPRARPHRGAARPDRACERRGSPRRRQRHAPDGADRGRGDAAHGERKYRRRPGPSIPSRISAPRGAGTVGPHRSGGQRDDRGRPCGTDEVPGSRRHDICGWAARRRHGHRVGRGQC